jgi:pyruvate formate lyase activating enzyme
MEAANVDLKAFNDRFYRDLCGGDLETVKETLLYLRSETDVWLEITTLLIPGENDGDRELDELTRWIAEKLGAGVPLHFTAFHPSWRMLGHPPTPLSTLRRAREIGLRNGLRYVYTGNIRDPEGAVTHCHACGAPLIRRDGYVISGWALGDQGRCRACGALCAGIFEAEPGNWGNRRLPVKIEV